MREKIIVLGVLAAILVPARFLFLAYVSEYWLGSLGLLSSVSVTILVLAKKGRLGRFGPMFERQMGKMTQRRMGKIALAITFFSIIFFSFCLFLNERGNTLYSEEKAVFVSILKGTKPDYQMTGREQNIDFVPSVAISMINDITFGWMEHINLFILVGELEALGVLLLYRHALRNNLS